MSTYYQPHKLPTVRPPWGWMLLSTIVGSQVLAAAFLFSLCGFLGYTCQFAMPKAETGTARMF